MSQSSVEARFAMSAIARIGDAHCFAHLPLTPAVARKGRGNIGKVRAFGYIRSSMASENDFASRGKFLSVENGVAKLQPAGTNYEHHLQLRDKTIEPPIGSPVEILIRIEARKVYTVPSGGNFVSPIFGPPRIIQGRVLDASESRVVVRAGANFLVQLPDDTRAIDLNNGQIRVGAMINVVALPGATVELVEKTAASGR
jgi:hypothetical protein